jgi:hypothetical protein
MPHFVFCLIFFVRNVSNLGKDAYIDRGSQISMEHIVDLKKVIFICLYQG